MTDYFIDENNRAEDGFMTTIPDTLVGADVECYVGFYSQETGAVLGFLISIGMKLFLD